MPLVTTLHLPNHSPAPGLADITEAGKGVQVWASGHLGLKPTFETNRVTTLKQNTVCLCLCFLTCKDDASHVGHEGSVMII